MNPVKVFVGLSLVMLGLMLLAIQNANVQYGSVFIIGPFPIVLASSPEMAFVAILIAIVMLLALLLMVR